MKTFDELIIGQVFSYTDGRMSEAETWIPFVKTGENEARMLVIAGMGHAPLTDTKCLGYFVTTDVHMLTSQKANHGMDSLWK